MAKASKAKQSGGAPLLEWIAAALGLILTLGVMAVIARDAFVAAADLAPDLAVTATRVRPARAGFLLEFEARNASPITAAQVTVEGKLPGGETSTATIDYVPGRSARRGGLYFGEDPRGVELRVLGFQDP
jgi:uncharacterized protein (TIGR02588 family)